MQAAVWSQPHSSNAYCLSGGMGLGIGSMPGPRRKSSGHQYPPPGGTTPTTSDHLSPTTDDYVDDMIDGNGEVPKSMLSSVDGRPILGLGLALVIFGSILGLFGVAGLFSSGDDRLSIGLGAIASVMAILAGVTASRAGKNFVRNRLIAIQCAIFSILCLISDMVCIGFCVRIIIKDKNHLLQAIAGAEVFFAAVGLLLSFSILIVTITLLCRIPKCPPVEDKVRKEDLYNSSYKADILYHSVH